MLIYRFKWEHVSDITRQSIRYGRIQSMIIVDGVLKVRSKGIRHDKNTFLSILQVKLEKMKYNNEIEIIFSGGAIIRLEIEFIRVFMKDLENTNKRNFSKIPKHNF